MMEDRILWIMFFQTPYNSVKYITNTLDSYSFMGYHKFLEYLYRNFFFDEPFKLKESIDKFDTIFLDCVTGKWEIKKPEPQEFTFEELYALNEEKEETNKIKNQKEYINGFSRHSDKTRKDTKFDLFRILRKH